jgi:hypothetical protein
MAPPYSSAPPLGSVDGAPGTIYCGHAGDSPEFSDYVRAYFFFGVMY